MIIEKGGAVALAELIADIRAQDYQAWTSPEAVVSLELFFEENESSGSIGCNLSGHPGIATFYEVLRSIRDRAEVEDVQVGITEVMPTGEWPFSDHVFVIGSMTAKQVGEWAAKLRPDTAQHGWGRCVAPRRLADVSIDVNVVRLWWD